MGKDCLVRSNFRRGELPNITEGLVTFTLFGFVWIYKFTCCPMHHFFCMLTWHLIHVPGQVVLPTWAALGSTLGQGVTQGASTIPVESLSVDLNSERSMHLFSPGNIVLKVCGLTQKRCHIATSREIPTFFGLK